MSTSVNLIISLDENTVIMDINLPEWKGLNKDLGKN